ncbi:MAG: nickel-dependent lactate racemase [Chloroflexi bacterium]|nr:nickel-dependent lactate racemase [Chloroflexota bacterium]
MANFRIPYGKTHLTFDIPDSFHTQILAPAPISAAPDPAHAVNHALDNPVGGVRLENLARARSVAIAINDKTRPVPLPILLPPLLRRLAAIGAPKNAITFVIANGVHPPMTQNEFGTILPADLLTDYRVVSHNAEDRTSLVDLGETQRGTPVWINRNYVNADLRIVVGNLEPHQFMGFSGGVKTAAVGVCGKETINHNHAMMLDPRANIARYDDNPARQDVEEIGKRIGVHFALNALINENKQIVHVIAGDPHAVMPRAIPRVMELYQVRVSEPFDLMITSPGGHPKDINLYQSQKALAHATFVTKEGGTVILAAACPEGTGSQAYEDWVAGMKTHEQVLARFKREGFRVGPHKAFQISRDAARERVLFITDMPHDFVKRLLLTPCESLDTALAIVLRDLPKDARVGILPWGNATIPVLG